MAKFIQRKKTAALPPAPSPSTSLVSTVSRAEETVKADLRGCSTQNTCLRDNSLNGSIDPTNTPFKYAYKYGIALCPNFLDSAKTSKAFKEYQSKMEKCGAFIFQIMRPQLSYFYSFGSSGFISYDNDPVQIKWLSTPTKQEKYRMSHFLHYLNPQNGCADNCLLIRASWYFIDADKSQASIIHAPTPEELKHLDTRIKKEMINDCHRMTLVSEFFITLEKKEQNSAARKRKASPTINGTPKRQRMAEIRKQHEKAMRDHKVAAAKIISDAAPKPILPISNTSSSSPVVGKIEQTISTIDFFGSDDSDSGISDLENETNDEDPLDMEDPGGDNENEALEIYDDTSCSHDDDYA